MRRNNTHVAPVDGERREEKNVMREEKSVKSGRPLPGKTALASEFYDEYARQGEENRASRLAEKYRMATEYRTISQKALALIDECDREKESSDAEKLKKKIIIAQAIALLGRYVLADANVKRPILSFVTRTYRKKEGTALKTAAKNAAKIGSYVAKGASFFASGSGKIALKLGAAALKDGGNVTIKAKTKVVEIDKPGVGEAARGFFLTAHDTNLSPAEIHGLKGNDDEAEFCLHCATKIANRFMADTSKIYFAHRIGEDEDKISKAIQSYALLKENEDVVIAYDSTIFGGADEGIALTTKRLFYCQGESKMNVRYSNIKDVHWEEGKEALVLEQTNGIQTKLSDLGDAIRAKRLRKAILFMSEEVRSKMSDDDVDETLSDMDDTGEEQKKVSLSAPDHEDVFTPEIRNIVLRHCAVSAGIAIIPGIGPATDAFNQTVMIQLINQELGIQLDKGKIWPVVKRAGLMLLSSKAISFGASFLPVAGSAVSATIEAASTFAVAYVYVNMMRKFFDANLDISKMTDEEFAASVDQYSDENKDVYTQAFKEGKNFYKKNKDAVSTEEIERMKAEVIAGAKQEVAEDALAASKEPCGEGEAVCSNCGAKLPQNAEFCMECGKPVERTHPTHCPNCGVKVPDGAKFCVACGEKIE